MNNIQVKKRTFTLSSLVTASLTVLALTSTAVNAKITAITNATVHTVASQGILEQATVIIDEGVITQVYANENTPENIEADEVIDAKGRILTPGFIGTMNALGLVEVGAVSRTRDGRDEKADITFDASSHSTLNLH